MPGDGRLDSPTHRYLDVLRRLEDCFGQIRISEICAVTRFRSGDQYWVAAKRVREFRQVAGDVADHALELLRAPSGRKRI